MPASLKGLQLPELNRVSEGKAERIFLKVEQKRQKVMEKQNRNKLEHLSQRSYVPSFRNRLVFPQMLTPLVPGALGAPQLGQSASCCKGGSLWDRDEASPCLLSSFHPGGSRVSCMFRVPDDIPTVSPPPIGVRGTLHLDEFAPPQQGRVQSAPGLSPCCRILPCQHTGPAFGGQH